MPGSMPDIGHPVETVTVAGDALRCELHGQCEGLSRRVFRARGTRLVVPLTPGLERAVRSCPVDALRIAPSDPPHEEQL